MSISYFVQSLPYIGDGLGGFLAEIQVRAGGHAPNQPDSGILDSNFVLADRKRGFIFLT